MKLSAKITFLLLTAAITFFSVVPALAGRMVKIPTIQIQKTGNHMGQFVHVYYGFEKTAIIRPDKNLISLDEVRAKQVVQISGDSVQIPAVEIAKEGIRGAYDVIYVMVSPHQNFVWKNADGSVAKGLTDSGVNQYSLTSSKKSSDIESHVAAQGENSTFVWPLF